MSGFVLFAVLIFLQIFSLMGLYGLSTSAIAIKTNQDTFERNNTRLNTKKILSEINHRLLTEDPQCVISISSNKTLIKKPLTWWQEVACHGNLSGNSYFYVVEFLGKDSCSVINESANNQKSATYHRVTLFFLPKSKKKIRIFLQSTVAKAENEIPSCMGEVRSVTAGQQMWREI